MTKENIDEMILFILNKYGSMYGLMLFAISRYIRKEFSVEIDSDAVLCRLTSLRANSKVKTRKNSLVFKGNYYYVR